MHSMQTQSMFATLDPTCLRPLHPGGRQKKQGLMAQASKNDSKSANSGAEPGSTLSATLKRKRRQLTEVIQEYTPEDLATRLGLDDPAQPANPMQYRFSALVPDVKLTTGRPVVAVELRKPSPDWSPGDLAELAQLCEEGGADAVVIPTDAEDSSTGLADLLAVCRRVKIPVARRDWILHPLQIREAKEAGAAAVLGVCASVLGKQGAVYSSYAASIGLDCPVEVVNAEELELMRKFGVPFIGCNMGVGLSIAGFQSQIARGLIEQMDFGISSMIGAKSMDEALQARNCGADVILVKHEWGMKYFNQHKAENPAVSDKAGAGRTSSLQSSKYEPMREAIANFLRELKYVLSGD